MFAGKQNSTHGAEVTLFFLPFVSEHRLAPFGGNALFDSTCFAWQYSMLTQKVFDSTQRSAECDFLSHLGTLNALQRIRIARRAMCGGSVKLVAGKQSVDMNSLPSFRMIIYQCP